LAEINKVPGAVRKFISEFTPQLGFLEHYELPIVIPQEIQQEFAQWYYKALSSGNLSKGYLERRFMELFRSGTPSELAVIPGTNITITDYLTRIISGYSGMLKAIK